VAAVHILLSGVRDAAKRCAQGSHANYLLLMVALLLLLLLSGLIDDEGGKRKLVLGVDDKLLDRNPRNIPRADVAALAVACIGLQEASKKSFDVICAPADEGAPDGDWQAVLGQLGAKTCDYSINSQLATAAV
jgi:hypothetical protein